MAKKKILLALLASFAVFFILIAFSFIEVSGEPTSFSFSVNLTISGNADPTITWVQTGITENPVESSIRTIYIAFNATDNNGFQDIDYSTAQITVTLDNEQERIATCNNFNNDTLTMQFNCSVDMEYYDKAGNWQINATIQDLATASAEDTSETLSYGTLQAVRANLQGITFGNLNLGQSAGSSNDPLVLNNTGNTNFTQINLTAYDLVGTSTPSQYIAASSLSVNAVADSAGDALSNNTNIIITSATLPRDIGGSDQNENLYFWVTVPGSGLSNQDYISSSDWVIQVG